MDLATIICIETLNKVIACYIRYIVGLVAHEYMIEYL